VWVARGGCRALGQKGAQGHLVAPDQRARGRLGRNTGVFTFGLGQRCVGVAPPVAGAIRLCARVDLECVADFPVASDALGDRQCATAGVLASLAELELELGKERRTAARDARRARGRSIGRPKALTDEKVVLARRRRDRGEAASTIATILGVSRATVYRVLSDDAYRADSTLTLAGVS